MVCEQVRTLLVASMLLTALGCGSGSGALDPASVWDDANAQSVAQAANDRPAVSGGYGANPVNIAGPGSPPAQPHSQAQLTQAQLNQAQLTQQQNYQGANNQAQNPLAPNASAQIPSQFVSHPSPYAPGSTQAFAGAPAQPHLTQPYPPQAASAAAPYANRQPSQPSPPHQPFSSPNQLPNGSVANAAAASRLEKFEPARIVAQVGDQYILAGDVLGAVIQMLEPHKDKLTEAQYAEQKERGIQIMVQRMLDNKLMYVSFLQEIPRERLEEAMTGIREQAFKQYDEKELEKAMEQAKVKTPAEYDAYLRQFGTSLYKQKLQYMEVQLGRTAVMQNINANPEITHQEMLDYYHDHLGDYDFEAKARWEKLTARFDSHPTREQARYALGVMGDHVRLGGAPLSAVAKRGSNGLDKNEGGYHDWTTRGSLRSKPLDEAIFTLPPGLLSNIIEDETGFHIVRVIERQEAGRTPFVDAQVEIRKTILNKKRQQQIAEFSKKLKREIPVWTVFDEKKARPGIPGAGAPGSSPAPGQTRAN